MTIQFDIAKLNSLDELLAVIDAGEDMTLVRDGKVIATVNVEKKPDAADAPKAQRRLGLWEHLNLDLPADLFIGPDPEIEALMDEPIFPPEVGRSGLGELNAAADRHPCSDLEPERSGEAFASGVHGDARSRQRNLRQRRVHV